MALASSQVRIPSNSWHSSDTPQIVPRESNVRELASSVMVQFTARQRRILQMLADGHSDESIARQLGLSSRSIRAEVATIRGALNAESRFQIGMRYAELRLRAVVEKLNIHDCGCSHTSG